MVERAMVAKVVLLGDSGVGKTALMRRFIKNDFDDQYKSLGLDFLMKDVQVGNVSVITQVWDTTGHERFSKVWPTFYKDADCCVLIFSLTDVGTFASLEKWRSDFIAQCRPEVPEKFPFVVVGNKADLHDMRRVPPEWTCIPIGDQMDHQCIETSAKWGNNVDKSFKVIVVQAMQYKHVVSSRRRAKQVEKSKHEFVIFNGAMKRI